MDKRVVFAVAGSGKTTSIIDRVQTDSRLLVVTYTDNNTKHLKNSIINKLGEIPPGVRVYSYFTFLYSFCYRPLFGYELKTKGINFKFPLPTNIQRSRKKTRLHYIDRNDRLYANRIAKFLIEFDVVPEVIKRIEKFFDLICFDEVQDFASNDFNFICQLAEINKDMWLVGDFFQHTFDTSRDGNIQRNLHNSFDDYCKKLTDAGFTIDLHSLSHSYRCSPTICSFVKDKVGIDIESHRNDDVEIVLVENNEEVENLFLDNSIVKLFYQKSNSYPGNTENWGNTKGLDHFHDVCIVLNPTTFQAYNSETLHQLASTTKNKFYVACTRAKGNLYFVKQQDLAKYKDL